MRLLKLKIKNIASLKGEHEINWSEIQNVSPLFAITGETGAGKSTILNCLGLALYGQVYKKNVNQIDTVTLGEKEGQIELIFQVKGINYLIFWRAKVLKQNGEPYAIAQTPTRHVYRLEGSDFDSEKTITSERVEDLLNLDFDQFCKCVILNQGEFARFLSSSFSERKDILEKLYPGQLIESLSRELNSQRDNLKDQKSDLDIELQTLKGDSLSGDDLLTDVKQLKTKLQTHDEWLKYLEKQHYQFVSLVSHHKNSLNNETKLSDLAQDLKARTGKYNQVLIKNKSLSDELKKAQDHHDKEQPRLRDLLTAEETYKNLTQELTQLVTRETALSSDLEKNKIQKTKLQSDQNLWESEKKVLEETFHHALIDLKKCELDPLFDAFTEIELIEQEIQSASENEVTLISSGKVLADDLKTIQDQLKNLSSDGKEKLALLIEQRKEIKLKTEERHKSQNKLSELQKVTVLREKEFVEGKSKKAQLLLSEKSLKDNLLPLETTLSLQEIMGAIELCLHSPQVTQNNTCPVCLATHPETHWEKLSKSLEKADFKSLKVKAEDLKRELMGIQEETKFLTKLEKTLETDLDRNKQDILVLTQSLQVELPNLEILDQTIEEAQKADWEYEKLKKDETKISLDLNRAREAFAVFKNELSKKTDRLKLTSEKVLKLQEGSPFIINRSTLPKLKEDQRQLRKLLELENKGEKIQQSMDFLIQSETLMTSNLSSLTLQIKDLKARGGTLKTLLETELKGLSAKDLMEALTKNLRELTRLSNIEEQELKNQELSLKELSSRRHSLEELRKDYEMLFIQTLETIKNESLEGMAPLNETVSQLSQKLKNLSLTLNGPQEILLPVLDLIHEQKELTKTETLELRTRWAQAQARLEDWDKKQDRIKLAELKRQDLQVKLGRLDRLFDVLGKDELRTFVLSLVEENLIHQTNDELAKLCQGRYEILHQSRKMKLSPEFYILDKFREGGLRKVSTLSGGETFMVSLAMALGLAEMTRGQAEIDSLFIDEGFGTLDQESLEDVLEMLGQIQTRGLMVGIISHVKALTQALPVNLKLQKRQDGTSSLSLQYN